MQAFVFDKLSTNNQSAVFPPLAGSHRKMRIIQVNSTPSPKVQFPLKEVEEEQNFLQRMKKARQVILSHQKRNKAAAASNQKRHHTEKIQQQMEVMKGKKKQSFSQVVYNINSHLGKNKKLNQNKKESIDSNKFNDKVLRQCKSEFMANLKDKPKKKNRFLSNKKHHTDRDDITQTPKSFLPNVEINPQLNFESLRKYRSKLIFSRKFNMKDFFNDEILDSNGSQLIQKLKKSLNDKSKENRIESIIEDEIKEQIKVEETKQTVQQIQKQDLPSASLKMGKKTEKLKKNRVKMNFFASNKKNLNEKLLVQIQEKMKAQQKQEVVNLRNTQPLSEVSSMKQFELENKSNQKQNIEGQKIRKKEESEVIGEKKRLREHVESRRKQEKKGMVTKYKFDENFKVQGWVNEPNIQFQIY